MHLWIMGSSYRLYRSTLADSYSPVNPVCASGCVFWWCLCAGRTCFCVYLEASLFFQLWGMGMEEHLDKTAGLVSNPSEALIWILGVPGFSDQISRWLGLDYIFRSRWRSELASLLWQFSRMGPRTCIDYCLGTWIRKECVLNESLS